MSLARVYLSAQVVQTCAGHAFVTEKEEIMGLLLGRVCPSGDEVFVRSCTLLKRSDRKKDRVEIPAKQLST